MNQVPTQTLLNEGWDYNTYEGNHVGGFHLDAGSPNLCLVTVSDVILCGTGLWHGCGEPVNQSLLIQSLYMPSPLFMVLYGVTLVIPSGSGLPFCENL